MTVDQIKDKISRAFERYLGVLPSQALGLVSTVSTAGKVYEAYVLALLARDLTRREGYSLTLSRGSVLKLKSSAGPINQQYPRIIIKRAGAVLGEIWTDLEFTALSYWKHPGTPTPTPGDYHELDIVMTTPNASGRPTPDQVFLGVECKHTPYQKHLLREILGVRRELSLLTSPKRTIFRVWPRRLVPAHPPSCLLVYSSSSGIGSFISPGATFGIDFFHEPV